MKHTALTILFGFVFSLFYCEGMDVLLKKFNNTTQVESSVVCAGDAASVELAAVACEEIKGDLTIINTELRSLEMFSAIEIVSGSIIVENNSVLNNINGLGQLKYIKNDFIINNNAKLTEIEVRRVILRILNDNDGYIGGSIIFNHSILDIEIVATTDI